MPDLPPLPQAEGWVTWIIGTLITALMSMLGTIVALARKYESKYQTEVADLKQQRLDDKKQHDSVVNELKQEFAADRAASKAVCDALQKETTECRKDREALAVKVASLEARVSRVEIKKPD